jgi:hypothetical protein
MTAGHGDYWVLAGFDRETGNLVEEHVLEGKSGWEWGDLFGRPDGDPLLGDWEVTETEAEQLQTQLGHPLDLVTRIYLVGRVRDL